MIFYVFEGFLKVGEAGDLGVDVTDVEVELGIEKVMKHAKATFDVDVLHFFLQFPNQFRHFLFVAVDVDFVGSTFDNRKLKQFYLLLVLRFNQSLQYTSFHLIAIILPYKIHFDRKFTLL